MTTITSQQLVQLAKQDEAKTLYLNHKASCNCPDESNCNCVEEWDTPTLTNGGSAHCIVSGNTITVNYINGVSSIYTHDGSEIIPDENLTLQIINIAEKIDGVMPVTKL